MFAASVGWKASQNRYLLRSLHGCWRGRQVICPLFLPTPQHPLSITSNPAPITPIFVYLQHVEIDFRKSLGFIHLPIYLVILKCMGKLLLYALHLQVYYFSTHFIYLQLAVLNELFDNVIFFFIWLCECSFTLDCRYDMIRTPYGGLWLM